MPITPLLGPNDELGRIRNNVSPAMEAINKFNVNDFYHIGHKEAISPLGKGPDGQNIIGSADDITARNNIISTNKYNASNIYKGPY